MDELVKAAMAKWPNVPHCYGWLSLDARGNWRMRDERAQTQNLPGDKINNVALNAFINRNYACDENGCWYFQNGPQKVYVDLCTMPYIAHVLPDGTWKLHTGQVMPKPDRVFLGKDGDIIFQSGRLLMQVDDRDLAYTLDLLRQDDQDFSEEMLLAWLVQSSDETNSIQRHVSISVMTDKIDVQFKTGPELMLATGYIAQPRPLTINPKAP
jgi:hypothetical protein